MTQQGPCDPPQGLGTTFENFYFLTIQTHFWLPLVLLAKGLKGVLCRLLGNGGHPLDPELVM